MERLPHREEYENLLVKQEGERKHMVNEAHGEALKENAEINEHQAKIQELKGTEGEKTPETQEKLKMRSIELPEMVGKPLFEVVEYLRATYGEAALARIPDDLDELSEKLKDKYSHYFFGSASRKGAPHEHVPYAYWYGGRFGRDGHSLSYDWRSSDRVVLLEN